MRKPTHTKKFSVEAGALWYTAALMGLLLYCFVPFSPPPLTADAINAEKSSAVPAVEPRGTDLDAACADIMDDGSVGSSLHADAVPVFLMQGDSGAEVFRLQSRLRMLGYDVGDDMGIYTLQTASAVRRFQLDCGFVGDGVCSAGVSRALAYLADGTAADPAIPTEAVCRALEEAGCLDPLPDEEDAQLPQEVRMRNALILFQRTHGLCGSGETDYATLCALGLWRGDRFAASEGTVAAEAAQFDLRCRLLTEALADYVRCYPAAYDLYTLTVCASMLCNRVEDPRFPGGFDAVCAAGADMVVTSDARRSPRDDAGWLTRDLLLLRAAEDALRTHMYTDVPGTDPARGALYVCPTGGVLPQDADICICVRDFVFFR